jgi:hypothetical protein
MVIFSGSRVKSKNLLSIVEWQFRKFTGKSEKPSFKFYTILSLLLKRENLLGIAFENI